MGYDVAYVLGEISGKVSNQISSLGRIVGASCNNKSWKPQFPMSHDVWSILPAKSLFKVDV